MSIVPPPAERCKANLLKLVSICRSVTESILRQHPREPLKDAVDWLVISEGVIPSMGGEYLTNMFLSHTPPYMEQIMTGDTDFFRDNMSQIFKGAAQPIASAFHDLYASPHLLPEQKEKITHCFQCVTRCALNHARENPQKREHEEIIASAIEKYLRK